MIIAMFCPEEIIKKMQRMMPKSLIRLISVINSFIMAENTHCGLVFLLFSSKWNFLRGKLIKNDFLISKSIFFSYSKKNLIYYLVFCFLKDFLLSQYFCGGSPINWEIKTFIFSLGPKLLNFWMEKARNAGKFNHFI